MKATDSQFFPYPENTDPGDAALELQVLAESVDAKLVSEFTDFRSVINRKVTVWRAAADLQTIPANSVQTFSPLSSDLVYSSVSDPLVAIPDWSSSVFSDADPGYFRVGLQLATQTVGAVTANSIRKLTLSIFLSNTATFQIDSTEVVTVEGYDNGLGLQYQFCEILTAVTNTQYSKVTSDFFHTNVASDVNIKATTVFWVYRVCDLD